jgi:hypothetical protein
MGRRVRREVSWALGVHAFGRTCGRACWMTKVERFCYRGGGKRGVRSCGAASPGGAAPGGPGEWMRRRSADSFAAGRPNGGREPANVGGGWAQPNPGASDLGGRAASLLNCSKSIEKFGAEGRRGAPVLGLRGASGEKSRTRRPGWTGLRRTQFLARFPQRPATLDRIPKAVEKVGPSNVEARTPWGGSPPGSTG